MCSRPRRAPTTVSSDSGETRPAWRRRRPSGGPPAGARPPQPDVPALLTRDPAFRALLEVAHRAAGTQASVLLTGETGTGKNHLARFLHERSPRGQGPFVEVPCANLPQDLLERELFGHERGAFTDAHADRAGRFEQAHGGTLYLDEIQELAPPLQAKVLRAVELRRFERLGGAATLEVDVRIVASTREPLELLLAAGRLREDL